MQEGYRKLDQTESRMKILEKGLNPPRAVEIEELVLGTIMVDDEKVTDAMDVLNPMCFFDLGNREIFKATSVLVAAHNPVTIYSVCDCLERNGRLAAAGGPAKLSAMANKVGSGYDFEYNLKVLLEKYIQRELIFISMEIQTETLEQKRTVEELLNVTQQKIFDLSDKTFKNETRTVSEIINDTLEELQTKQTRSDGLSGVPSGYTSIDRITMGWQPSDLIIIAARPSMGKTAFVLTMARNMAINHHIPVAFFSLEMSGQQLVSRLMISETGIDAAKLKGGQKMTGEDWNNLNERIAKLTKCPLYIDTTPGISIYEFRSKARKMVLSRDVKVIVIDYLQLMSGPPELRAMREQEVSAISRSLKNIAKELNVPIIALSQLSRAVETRGGAKIPQLSDLRESGAIEQDADIVMFIHRPEYYGLEQEAEKGKAQIIIAKHRNGATGEVNLKFRNSEVKFVEYEEESYIETEDGKLLLSESKTTRTDTGLETDISFDIANED